MGHLPHDPHCACAVATDDDCPDVASPRLSRRALLASAAVAGLGALGLSYGAAALPTGRAARLDRAANALLPARRIPAVSTTAVDGGVPGDSVPGTTVPGDIVPGSTTTVPADGDVGSSTTTTTPGPGGGDTVGPLPFVAPEAGEILFPVVVGEDDHCGVIDNFGDTRGRPAPYYHKACDIMADEGLPLRAVVDGVLTKRYENSFFGWTLYDEVDDVVYKYFHNTADANGFAEGDEVRQGDIIGFVGDTGTSPGNFHLHFEYRPGNVPADCFHKLQRADHVLFWG